MKRLRICHVINDLRVGGAQTVLCNLLSRLDCDSWENSVVTLIGGHSTLEQKLRGMGVPVESAGLPHRVPTPAGLLRLVRAIGRAKPDLIQTWLFHSDLLGGLAANAIGHRVPVVWNIRRGSLLRGIDPRTTLWTAKLCARLSTRLPSRIVVNSEAGRKTHVACGYADDRFVVIPNGFDTSLFRPSARRRKLIRCELGLSENTPLVGLIGRYTPEKDHASFIKTARLILELLPDAHFLCCGTGVTRTNETLWHAIQRKGYSQQFHLLGCRKDMPAIQASLDVAVSSSIVEGFPNAIGEAMACAVPCVVTDVGGSAEVVGDTGRVVAPNDRAALAAACLDILGMPPRTRTELGLLARKRVDQSFSLDSVADLYGQLWDDVIAGRPVSQRGTDPQGGCLLPSDSLPGQSRAKAA